MAVCPVVYSLPSLRNTISAVKRIWRPKYIILNIVFGVIYYYFLLYLVVIQRGTLFFIIPQILIYSMVITSSVMLTIAVYSISNTRRNSARFSASGAGAGSIIAGSTLCGCTSSFPILLATAVGISFDGLLALKNFLINYGPIIFSLLVALNLVVILYYLNKLPRPGCRAKK